MRWGLAAALLLVPSLLLLSPHARAHSGGPVLDLRPQASLGVMVGLPEARRFGAAELHATASIFGVGLAVGIGWEQTVDDNAGGYFASTVEMRPLTWSKQRSFRSVDLVLGFGGLLGGLEGPEFHGALLGTMGADIALWPMTETQHLALMVQYRVSLLQQPDDATTHLFMLGLSFRVAH